MTEGSRSTSRSRSRRSYPNLHSLSLAPLSSKYPLDGSRPPSPDAVQTPSTSYIAQKSAPATPGILSLSQSRSNSRHRSRVSYAYDGYFPASESNSRDFGDIPKAKSTSTLQPGVNFADEPRGPGNRHHVRKATAPLPLRMPLVRHHTSEPNDEWFHRAGLAIAGETRDSKGQGWLVRRESSTSLVQDNDVGGYEQPRSARDTRHMALLSGENLQDVDFPTFFSPRMSRVGSRIASRIGSRVPSARQSRRGSRVGSRADLLMSAPSGRQSLDQADDERFIEPDFIDDGESDGDEEEVARLARERGFGLGSWMDRLMGWTLFSVDEDGEASSDSEREDNDFAPKLESLTKEDLKLKREIEARRRKMERETINAASARNAQEKDRRTDDESSRPSTADAHQSRANEDADGWQDAAWLLSVASKALF